MKLACMTLPYAKHSFERALEGISRAGYKYVAFGWPHMGADVPDETSDGAVSDLQRLFDKYSLDPVSLSGYRQFAVGQPLERARRCLEIAKELGIDEVLSAGTWTFRKFPEEPLPEDEQERLHREYVEKYKQVAAIAEELGRIITIKPHSGNTATSAHILRAVREIGSPNVRASYDPGNVEFYEGLDSAEDFVSLAASAYSIVAKDHRGARANADFPVPGTGDVNFPAIFKMMKQAGFDGSVIVERADGPTELEAIDERMTAARIQLQRLLDEAGF
ncbi:MAG: family glycosyltransferase [Paenibacillus sp.]|nr:family glycosyltransferase [Paenibacillus sp.]